MAFPEISQQDVWWRHVVPDNPMPALALGARIKQDMLQYGIQLEDLKIRQQQAQMAAEEHVLKMKIQTQLMEGSKDLAQYGASVEDWSDPSVKNDLMEFANKNPAIAGGPVWKSFLQFHEDSVKRKAQIERQSSVERRLDILSEHYENQDEVNRLKAEAAELNRQEDSLYKQERLRQIDEQAARLETDQKLRQEEFARKQALMSPEKRILLKNELQSLENESFGGKVLDPDTGEQSATEYKRRKALIQQKYFGSSKTQPTASPAAPSSQPLPLPANKSELKQGQQYNTARGVATWDGEKFVQ